MEIKYRLSSSYHLCDLRQFDFMTTTANCYVWPSVYYCSVSGKVSVSHLEVRQFSPQLLAAIVMPQVQYQGSLGTTHFSPSSFVSLKYFIRHHSRCLPRGNFLCLLLNLARMKEKHFDLDIKNDGRLNSSLRQSMA